MNIVLSVYSKGAFKEFILPSINNSDFSIVLHKDYFQINEDFQLNLEVMNNNWSFKKNSGYSINVGDQAYKGQSIKDSDILQIKTRFNEDITIIVKDVEDSFKSYKKFRLRNISDISIGKSSNCDIVYNNLGMISHDHAHIVKSNNTYKIINKSPNGIYVNAAKVDTETTLSFGAFINVLGLHIVFLGDILAVDTSGVTDISKKFDEASVFGEGTVFLNMKKGRKKGKTLYHRAPRNYENIDEEVIEIETPPVLNKTKHQSLLMSIGPSVTMALPMILGCVMMMYASSSGGGNGLYMYSGLIMAVSSAMVGVVWALVNIRQQKKEEREAEKYRFNKYSEYLIEKTELIKGKYQDAINKLNEKYPSADACLNYDESKGVLWSRNRTHADFLQHRLGIGDIPFPVKIEIPKKKFTLDKDDLAEKPTMIKENYQTLYNVPVLVDLVKKNLIGVIGGEKKSGALQIARILTAQLAANTCYTDVKLGFIYDENSSDNVNQWSFAKWLPHVWSKDKKTRFMASSKEEASEVFYELTKVFRERAEEKSDNKKMVPKPYYVIFISDVSLLEGELFSKYVFEKDKKYGLTTILLADRYEELPNNCEFIIENTPEFCGLYDVFADQRKRQSVEFDNVKISSLEIFSRHLSSLKVLEVEEGGEIPNAITFFDMFGINKPEELPVKELWAKSRIYENIKGLIGQKAGGTPCYLDVHEKYHGPHGLIAGTTGSGKSETLQTYMLSLAVNYSPDDIGFFIIDYKGGGMANLFEGLPHMVGQISNLSGTQVKRAMISIKSENRRRQRVFTENGVNNINAYTKLYKNGETSFPVPHLFIIIDEFAELKREEPDFMRELISVAQVGRSLGVHLILATQKPSGTVDDNIWSNSKFRLCLRVQDQQDSKDMLHKPDAAYITQAGRCYMQVGNDEVYELFQSGYSGATYDKNMLSGETDIAKMIDNTGKIEITGNSVKLSQKKHAELIWIDSLIECMEQALESLRISLLACMDSEAKMQKLIEEFYIRIEEKDIDYPQNKYNTARLNDFVELYIKALELDSNLEMSEKILQIASESILKLPQAKEKTQLDVVKEHLSAVAANNGYNHKLQLWMPLIPDHIYLDEFDEYNNTSFKNGAWHKADGEWNLSVLLGKMDDPENQNQMPLSVDFAEDGNIAVLGTIVCGKSTLMQTLAYSLITKYDPSVINIYAIDFSSKMMSAFEDAPHFGGVMYENDLDKIDKFFNMISNILQDRKNKFRGGNYKQFVQVNGIKLPSIVIFIDNYASFKEKTGELYEDQLIRLSKEGISHGIYLVVSGSGFGMNDITTRVGENLNTTLCLAMQDKYAYGDYLHNMQIEVLPESGIKGRGLAYYGNRILEYQTALAVRADNDYERMERIRSVCAEMKEKWTGKCARKIPEIPQKPIWSKFSEMEEFEEAINKGGIVPVGYDDANASVYSVPLSEIYCYLICGAARTGKTNYMKVFIQSVLKMNAEVCIIDSPDCELLTYSDNKKVTYANDERSVFEYFKGLLPIFKERNVIKNELLSKELEDDEIYERISKEKPYFIFISDFHWFVPMIYNAELDMKGFLENIISRGTNHNIFFVTELDLSKRADLVGYGIYEHFVSYKTGIHFGGKVIDNQVFSFDYMPYAEQSKTEKAGVGLLPNVKDSDTRKVIVPLSRR